MKGLAPGPHGIHIHSVGVCTPPDFASAGGHLNPTKKEHGLENPKGPHAGDLQNLEVGADGSAKKTLETDLVTLSSLGNASLVIHEKRDDEKTNPAGDSGKRVACGMIHSGAG